jgi:hypothetical protein
VIVIGLERQTSPAGLGKGYLQKKAGAMAGLLGSKKVSPKGRPSGVRTLT